MLENEGCCSGRASGMRQRDCGATELKCRVRGCQPRPWGRGRRDAPAELTLSAGCGGAAHNVGRGATAPRLRAQRTTGIIAAPIDLTQARRCMTTQTKGTGTIDAGAVEDLGGITVIRGGG